MKRILPILFFLFAAVTHLNSQEVRQAFISGSLTASPKHPVFGEKGVANERNIPGARGYSVTWTTDNGDIYLFGGYGFDSTGTEDYLNDLWKWDGLNWTWLSGEKIGRSGGVYGTKNIPNPANQPGARRHPATWVGKDGNLYLFGGQGPEEGGNVGELNDLWRWDGENWTWLSGSKLRKQKGVYGVKGVANPNNVPGGRQRPSSWVAGNGDLYLFGGDGFDHVTNQAGELNDFWKWDGQNWTWISGSNTKKSKGVFNTQGTGDPTNVPGARENTVFWTAPNGEFYLFGGDGYDGNGAQGLLNDLWKWDGTNWVWVSGGKTREAQGDWGSKGQSISTNVPSGRSKVVAWVNKEGIAFLFGGYGFDGNGDRGRLNDLWKWDGVNWTWISGDKFKDSSGSYGIKGTAVATNLPIGREYASGWCDSNGDLFLYGGYDVDGGRVYLNELWKWDGTNWTWINGEKANSFGEFGVKGVINSSNSPGKKRNFTSWGGENGEGFIFGGFGKGQYGNIDSMNDLWKWDGENWTWLSGSDTLSASGNYGIKGVPAPTNVPGARTDVVSWYTPDGDAYIFGGEGYDANGDFGYLNDLWKWDGAEWTWVSGNKVVNQDGNYGQIGIENALNTPSARKQATSWVTPNGDMFLFGGRGKDGVGGWGFLNDLWKWTGSNWIWINGPKEAGKPHSFGDIGQPSATNLPRSRVSPPAWSDLEGNLYLFGGFSYENNDFGIYNDFWMWNGVNWVWLGGGLTNNEKGIYGEKSRASSSSFPGARTGSSFWQSSDGLFYLSGGSGIDAEGNYSSLNDLWRWDGDNWIWISGESSNSTPYSRYGEKGVFSVDNTMGWRSSSSAWVTDDQRVFIYGGVGYDINGNQGALADLWEFSIRNDQELTFNKLSNKVFGDPNFILGATASSGLPVSYKSSNNEVAEVEGGSIKIISAGTTVITASQAGNDFFTNATDISQTLTIEKAPLTATAENKTKTYGAANPEFTVVYSGFVNGDDKASITEPTASTVATNSTDVGTVPIVLAGGDASNYTLSNSDGILTIEKAPLTATAENKTKTYGAANPEFTVAYSGFVNGDDKTSITEPTVATTATVSTGAGTVPITLSGGSALNYALSTTDGALTVEKATLTATAENKTKTYGAANPPLTIAYSGFVNGDDKSSITEPTVATTATVSTGVGTVPITLSGGSASNYTLSKTDGALTVEKATLTATAENKTKTYGAPNPALTIAYSGFVNDEDKTSITEPTVATTATVSTGVGTVPITLSGGSASNYTLNKIDGILTIEKTILTVKANDLIKNKGQANPELTVGYAGFFNGDDVSVIDDTPSIATLATTSSDRGKYDITLSGGLDDNYELKLENGMITVTGPVFTLPASIGFDALTIGSTDTKTITINNTGDGALEVSGITVPIGYSIDKSNFDITNGNSFDVVLTFSPLVQKSYVGNLVISSNDGTSNIALSGEGEVVTGIDDGVLDLKVKVYPNPTDKWLIIDLSESSSHYANISIVDVSGVLIWEERVTENLAKKVDVSSFGTGLYLVFVETNKGTVIKKILIGN